LLEAANAKHMNGHIRRLAFFPKRLDNAIIQRLTESPSYAEQGVATKYRAGLMPPITNSFAEAQTFQDGFTSQGDTSFVAGFRLPINTLTISGGAITITGGYHRLGGEGGAADDLDTINGGQDGQILVLRALSDSVTITVKDGTGNLSLEGDCTLDNYHDTITLIYDGATASWLEIARSNNGV